MTETISFIPSRVKNCAEGGHVAGARDIIDDGSGITLDELVGNKDYDSTDFSGMGRVVLKKNIIDGVNTLTQDMFKKGEVGSRVPNTNTIYVIQYDFTLGEDITLPANCVLEFDGGSIANSIGNDYYIDGNNGIFNQDLSYKIFDNVVFKNFALEYIDIRWFGAKPAKTAADATEDSAPYFQKAMDMCEYYQGIPIKVIGIYRIKSTVVCEAHFQLYGNNYVTRQFINGIPETPESMIVVDSGVTAFHIKGISPQGSNSAYCSFNIHNIKFVGPTTQGNSGILFHITTSDYPGRPATIRQCKISGFKYAVCIEFNGVAGTMLCNLSINECNVDSCGSFIYTEDTDYMTLQNLHVYDNVIEQCKGNAIVLCNSASYVHIENNLMESNIGYNLYIEKSIKQCHIEINGNYFEDQNKYVYIKTQELEITLNSHDNYFYKNSGLSTITLERVRITSLEDFEYFLSSSSFKHCWFDKTVSIDAIPITCLVDYNWFENIPEVIGKPYYSAPLKPSVYDVVCGELGCVKSTFGTNTNIMTDYTTVIQDTVAGDKAIFIIKANAINAAFNFNTIYGKNNTYYKETFTQKTGYLIVVVEYPENGNGNIAAGAYMSTNNQDAFFGSSVTMIELRRFPKVKKVGDLCCAKSLVNTTILSNSTEVVPAFDDANNKPIWWNGTAWVDATGAAV